MYTWDVLLQQSYNENSDNIIVENVTLAIALRGYVATTLSGCMSLYH